MMTLKRPISETDIILDEPPTKLAKQFERLTIGTHRLPKETEAVTAPESADMEGVEGYNFSHLSEQDWLDSANEVEIDDRFLKIPEHILTGEEKELVEAEKAASAPDLGSSLVLYRASSFGGSSTSPSIIPESEDGMEE